MAKDEEFLEPDRLASTPHPRQRYNLIGHQEGEKAFIEGISSNRLHHAWLIGGPQGIGKATLAYRVARYLLAFGLQSPTSKNGLYVSHDHLVSKQVEALSHPNLAVLRRSYLPDKKTVSNIIPVEAVRRAMSLFETTAADGGYRICIVDSAEDLNTNSANALLKLLEEPPSQSIFLIVSHTPQRLLPTIRSRCRRLTLAPLSPQEISLVITELGEPFSSAKPSELPIALDYGEGSVRKTLEMLDEGRATIISRMQGMLHDLPRIDNHKVIAFADMLSHRDATSEFVLAMECVEHWISEKLHKVTRAELSGVNDLIHIYEKLRMMTRDIHVFNLDRRPLILTLFDELAAAIRCSTR